MPLASAIINGALCQLTLHGARAHTHVPLGTAIVEFRHGPLCFFVREHPCGLLPGIANLYCLDASLRLRWLAEWPDLADPCAAILEADGPTIIAQSASGLTVRLDAHDGRLLGCEQLIAAAS